VKHTTKFSKIFEAYARVKQVELSTLRFLLDGERILPEQTPKMLDMEEHDTIDCLLEQIGGSPFLLSAYYKLAHSQSCIYMI
jgi:small ubiquitin-related modifier